MTYKTVLIAIQNRMGSTRLPRKGLKQIGDKMVLDHLIQSAKASLGYINEYSFRTKIKTHLCLVVPETESHIYRQKIHIIKGPENDVLSRYKKAINHYKCDYFVRLTADCPLVPPYLITKMIYTGIKGEYDYVSNVDLDCRTYPDGFDVEFVSRRALDWVETFPALEARHKEHVTLLLREECPKDVLKMGAVVGHLDLSKLKISLDTQEDFEEILRQYSSLSTKLEVAKKKYGEKNVQRF